MHHSLFIVLGLLFVICVLQAVSSRLKLSFPIVLVLAGLAISLVPGLPTIRLEPDLVFLVFLPPLLYEAAWFTSWRDFRVLRGPIALQAFGLVFVTSVSVAWVAHSLIAGLGWAAAFLLGGIVSPPDAVAATSVLQGIKVPRQPVAVLEGESLVNDASSLIVVRFALAAMVAGTFSLRVAVEQFFTVSLLGVAVGLIIARVMFAVHRRLSATPAVDTALTLMSPYLMYLTAESVDGSGVLAVVSGGLYLSYRSNDFLPPTSKIWTIHVWRTVIFVLNGVVFILIGLQLRSVISALGETSLATAIVYGLLISAVAIVTRLAWTIPTAFLPSFLPWRPKPRRFPPFRNVMLVAWAGMRGVVSLASALAIPLVLDDGSAFPQRALLIFITFVVILVTLVLQGLSLPLVVKLLRFEVKDDEEEKRHELEQRLTQVAVAHLDAQPDETKAQPGFAQLRAGFEGGRFRNGRQSLAPLVTELIEVQKRELRKLRNEGTVAHELALQKEYELDLDGTRLSRE